MVIANWLNSCVAVRYFDYSMLLDYSALYIEQLYYFYILYSNRFMLTRKMRDQHSQPFLLRATKPTTKRIKKSALRFFAKQKVLVKIMSRNKIQNKDPINNEKLTKIIDLAAVECPICFELPVGPVMFLCGHVQCLQCFEQKSVSTQKCCLCRQENQLMEVTPSAFVSRIVNNVILPNYTEEIDYWVRQSSFQRWEAKRRVDLNQLRIGDLVDVKEEGGWRVGVVKLFFYNKHHQLCVLIKIKINSELRVLSFPVTSRRLASLGFFTRGIYLQERNQDITQQFIESIAIREIDATYVDLPQEFGGFSEIESPHEMVGQLSNELPLQLFELEMDRESQQYLFL